MHDGCEGYAFDPAVSGTVTATADRQHQRALVAGRRRNLRQLLIRAARRMNAMVTRELARRGYDDVRPTHTAVLAHIDLKGTTISLLAQRTHNTKQATGSLVSELQERGYLRRRVDLADARARIVTFTPKGRALMLDTLDAVAAIERRLALEIGAAALKSVRDALESLSSIPD